MGKGWLFGKLGRGGEQQLKNTPMEISSQGKNWLNLDDLKMPGIVPIPGTPGVTPILAEMEILSTLFK